MKQRWDKERKKSLQPQASSRRSPGVQSGPHSLLHQEGWIFFLKIKVFILLHFGKFKPNVYSYFQMLRVAEEDSGVCKGRGTNRPSCRWLGIIELEISQPFIKGLRYGTAPSAMLYSRTSEYSINWVG